MLRWWSAQQDLRELPAGTTITSGFEWITPQTARSQPDLLPAGTRRNGNVRSSGKSLELRWQPRTRVTAWACRSAASGSRS